jgi:O-antigen/teichoic acid export membrane protein
MSPPIAGTVTECRGASVVRERRSWWTKLLGATSSTHVRGGLFSISDQVIVSGTSFATSVIIGRLGSQQDLGVFYLAFTLVILARGIQIQLVAAPFQVLGQRRRGIDLAEYSGSSFVHELAVIGLTVMGLLGIFGMFAAWGQGSEFGPVVLVLLAAGPLLLLRDFLRQFYFGRLRPGWAVGLDATVAVLPFGGLALIAGLNVFSVASAYVVMGGASGLAAAGWLFGHRRRMFRLRAERVWSDWRLNWRFGRWALASYLLGSASTSVLPWLILAACGEAAAGIWAACMTPMGVLYTFVQGVTNYLTPLAARVLVSGGKAELRHVLVVTAIAMLFVLSAVSVFIGMTGDWIVVFVYGDEYGDTGTILLALALTILLTSVGAVAGNGLWALERPSLNFAADVSTIAVTIGSAMLLVFSWGVLGAAIAALLGSIVGVTVRVWTLIRLLRRAAPEGESNV